MVDNLISAYERAKILVPNLKLKHENQKISIYIDTYEIFSSDGNISEDFVLTFLNGIVCGFNLKK